MSSRVGLSSVFLLFLILTFASNGYCTPAEDQNLWYSLYFQSVHSGYSHVVSSLTVWHGKRATREDSITVTKLTIFGTVVQQNISSTSYADSKSGQPFFQSFTIESGGSVTNVDAIFTSKAVLATLKSGSETSQKTIPIPPGEKIVDGDTEGMESDTPLKVGQTESDIEFDPMSLTLEKQLSTVQAVGLPVKDARYEKIRSTAKVYVTSPEGNATAFQDSKGTPILILMPASLVMVCTDKSHALADDNSQSSYANDPTSPESTTVKSYNPSSDLAIATAVNPTGLELKNERTASSLTVKVTVSGQAPKILTETAIAVPPSGSGTIASLSRGAAGYLGEAPYLSVNDPSIVSTAQQVIGAQTDAYQAVKLLHDWVYSQMSPVGSLGLPRSASDILADRQGVCRDYAILYATLARAAGIPTKINAGLVGFNGHFYYHAWASSYIGGTVGWLPVDPTLSTMFVDATHIPLASGDATVMFNMTGIIGNTTVETLNLRNSL